MLKKVILFVFSFCLVFSISVMAENAGATNYEAMPGISEQLPDGIQVPPQGERVQPGGRMPGGMGGFPVNMQNNVHETQPEQKTDFFGVVKTYSTPITSVILLIFAYIFVIFYRRKNY